MKKLTIVLAVALSLAASACDRGCFQRIDRRGNVIVECR